MASVRLRGLRRLTAPGRASWLFWQSQISHAGGLHPRRRCVDHRGLFCQNQFKGILRFFIVPNPYATFARIAQYFAESVDKPPPAGVHPSAFIDPSARLAPSASIGPYTVIEANAVVGERARLDAHVFIGKGATVGEASHL